MVLMDKLKRLIKRIALSLELGRRISLNLLFLGIVGSVFWFLLADGEEDIEEKTVLVLTLQGRLVEAQTDNDQAQWFLDWFDDDKREVVLPTLLQSLRDAAKDPKITKALLLTDGFEGGGLASMDELAKGLSAFRASGKTIIAWGTRYDQRQYFIASRATEVLMHPMGELLMEGFGRRRNYYRDALDRLGITPHLIRVGAYKSAGEAWVANRPSKQALEAEAHVIDDLWKRYSSDIESARKLPQGHLDALMASLPQALAQAGGDAGKLASDWQLVDGLIPYPDLRERLIREGVKEESYRSFRQVNSKAYAALKPAQTGGDHIGILVLEGEIRERGKGAQVIGGREAAEKIRKAADDDKLKALVIRVDSPGGSAVGSEFIRQALERFRQRGKPVVISMGDLAASGGYWISLSADRIIAHPNTITGSIGVFGLLPTAQGLMDKLSIRTGGYQSHWLAGGFDPRVDLDPRMKSLVESRIQHIYKDFIELSAKARGQSVAQIEQVAQGRIWSGAQAKTHQLVDELGGLDAAVAAARKMLADADGGNGNKNNEAKGKQREKPARTLQVRYLQADASWFGEKLKRWFRSMLQLSGLRGLLEPSASMVHQDPFQDLLVDLYREGRWAAQWLRSEERWSAQAHCFCSVEP
jgi:protease-4